MRILHRFTTENTAANRDELARIGIEPIATKHLLIVVVAESDKHWPEVERFARRRNAAEIVEGQWSEDERSNAAFLSSWATAQHGYPQPEDGWAASVYDSTEYCPECGSGGRQVAPFRLTKEPKWAKRDFLQLNWVFDEFFVKPETWEEIFRPFGVACMPVLEHSSGREFTSIVQLLFNETAPSKLDLNGYEVVHCIRCERPRYSPAKLLCTPRFQKPVPDRPMKSREWFGSGASSFRLIIVPHGLYARIRDSSMKGMDFKPMCSD